MKIFEVLRCLKGQPVQVVLSSGVKFCGIVVDLCDEVLTLLDERGRTVLIQISHIDAVIEPKMKLTPFCGNCDCCEPKDNCCCDCCCECECDCGCDCCNC